MNAFTTLTAPQAPAVANPDQNGEFPAPLDGALQEIPAATSTAIQVALEHAKLGIPIALLPAGQKGATSNRWQTTATTDPGEIARRAARALNE